MPDARRFAPAAARNREPLLAVLRRALADLPPGARVLELASGSGEHVAHFARALPDLAFQPTDVDDDALASIDAWRAHEGLANVAPARRLDVHDDDWGVGDGFLAVLCSNLVHIAPWSATLALLRGTARVLAHDARARLVLYGPYRRFGAHTAPSNEAFDASLRARDPRFGVRDLEAVERAARECGLALGEVVAMPANNFAPWFRRDAQSRG
ncbi:MAG: DUF938 domain-containing protein [Myxococcota bacterium]